MSLAITFCPFSFAFCLVSPGRENPAILLCGISGVTPQVTPRSALVHERGVGTARCEPGAQLLCSPKSGLNLLLFHSFVFLCLLYLPQIFLLWSYFRLSSKGSVPFLSINLQIKEIAPCSASVFGINAKKPPHYPDFPFFAVMPGGINTCPSQRFHSWNSSISNTLYFFNFFFFLF